MNRVIRDRGNTLAGIQTLEDRRVLAAFGNAWPEPRDLTVSFPEDGVQIGTYQNDINELLDSVAPRQQWQELVLRAYQTWSIHADINIGLRNDYNNDFGVPGKIVGDPRFGEFRIGALPQQGLVANSVPFQVVAGTYSGDLVLNSNEAFTYDPWTNDLGPDPATIQPGDRDLYSLFLHETGNTLGLNDNMLDWSVMFRQYTAPKGMLTAEDIAAVQAIYGQRSDPYELVDNGQIQVATLVPTPTDFSPNSEVIRSRGSLINGKDVDHYKIVPVAGQDRVTIRVRAEGVSLLQSRLEILDSQGQVIDQTDAQSVFRNDNRLSIRGLENHSELYLRVSAVDSDDVYSVGDYWLEIDYRHRFTRATDPSPGAYDSGPDVLFWNYDLIDNESGANDEIANAISPSPVGYSGTQRYEIESSVVSDNDVDFFKITAPEVISGRLIVHVTGVGRFSPDLRLNVVDVSGNLVGTAGRLHDNGTFSVEVAQPQAQQDYYVRISVDPNSTVGIGNYVAVAEFDSPVSQMNEMANGDLTSAADHYIRWTADKTKLFRFDLTATAAVAGQAVRLTIYDAHTRELKMVSVAHAGVTRSAFAWLQQGEYIIRFSAITLGIAAPTDVSYSLSSDGISDDQDNNGDDPGDDPYHDPYYYEFQYEYEYEYDPGLYGSQYDPYYMGYTGYSTP